MQADFVDIGETKNAFIHLKDLLPKLDIKTNNPNEIVNNSNIKDVVKAGKTLLIQVFFYIFFYYLFFLYNIEKSP